MHFLNRVFRSVVLAIAVMVLPLAGTAIASGEKAQARLEQTRLERTKLEQARFEQASLEIVVFEIADCAYCDIFRNRIGRKYRKSDFFDRAPLRFVDLESDGTAGMPLKRAVTTAPTIVVLFQGREVERVEGVPDAARFFKFVAQLIEIYG